MCSKARSVALLFAVALSGCGAEPARAPAAVIGPDPSAVADAGLPVIAPPPPVPVVTAHPIASAAPPPPPPAPPPPPPKTAYTESTGGPSCRPPPGKAVAFGQTSENHDPIYGFVPSGASGETADQRVVEVGVGERPGSSVAWAVETAQEIVFGVKVPEYCSGARPPVVTIRVTLPGGTKPIRAVLCSVDPCNFGPGPRPP
jgi:hypothetical protein